MGTVPPVRTFADKPDPTSILTYAEWNAALYDTLMLVFNPPMVHVRQTLSQSIPNNAWTALTFDLEIIDTEGSHGTTNPTRVTPKTPGWYMGWFGASWVASSVVGTRAVTPRKNGNMAVSAGSYGRMDWRGMTGGPAVKGMRFWMPFNGTTDYVELMSFQSSGAALGTFIGAEEVYPELYLRWWRTL